MASGSTKPAYINTNNKASKFLTGIPPKQLHPWSCDELPERLGYYNGIEGSLLCVLKGKLYIHALRVSAYYWLREFVKFGISVDFLSRLYDRDA